MEPTSDKSNPLTSYFKETVDSSSKIELDDLKAAAADSQEQVFDYDAAYGGGSATKQGPIGRGRFAKDPTYYRFPIVLECSLVNRDMFL